jgi:hypothetical protein
MSIGIMGHEKRPIDHLTVLLTNWPEFQSVGEGKYALVETQEGAK